MYEGHFKGIEPQKPREGAELRQFRWTDLVAKLAATRDLRDEFDKVEGGFTAFREVRRENAQESESPVNHDALSDGKSGRLSLGGAANDAAQGDREKE